ncbi:MAG TPA: short-chain dehydrogenase/reductase [Solirubrobacteraceae bacterium]|nr:short-chain dehydrogenase/reductase [Solirubrobacteraceae bacterium]
MARYSLQGKVALVTGGARGIGLGTAQAFTARGARVALLDLEAEEVERSAAALGSDRAIGIAADVTDATALRAAVATTVQRFGGIDVVVANAGIAPAPNTARNMDPVEFERVVEVDLLGVYRTVRAALPEVVGRRGQVVVVSSVYAFLNGMLVSPYAVSKAGVEALGRALRTELAPHGASATVAYFGFVDTRMVQDILDQEDPAGARQELLPEFIRRRISPAQAGEAVAEAVQRRRARVIAPRYWTALSVLRGVLNPAFDLLTARQRRVQDAVREAEAAGRGPDQS